MTEETQTQTLTPEEQAELQRFVTASAPSPEENHSVHKFLHGVSESDDTTKTGFLTAEEIGMPKLPTRSLKELSLFCEEIANMPYFAEYFKKESEIVTSTSLSKDAKLLELAVTARREVGDITKPKKENKGWFKKKNKMGDSE